MSYVEFFFFIKQIEFIHCLSREISTYFSFHQVDFVKQSDHGSSVDEHKFNLFYIRSTRKIYQSGSIDVSYCIYCDLICCLTIKIYDISNFRRMNSISSKQEDLCNEILDHLIHTRKKKTVGIIR
jgi:hypothetical protein